MEFMPASLSRDESDRLIEEIEAHFELHGFGPWAAELRSSKTFIGYLGLWVPRFEAHFTPAVEIAWRLAAQFWGQGLATEGAHRVVSDAFEELGLGELVSFTAPANRRSRRVMENLGMTHDAREDFDHPLVPEGHPLRQHILYRLAQRTPERS
jgi:RimJ/RimL family protein N-acetyltransferase